MGVIFSFLNSASAKKPHSDYPHVPGSADGWDCMEGHKSGISDFRNAELIEYPCHPEDRNCQPGEYEVTGWTIAKCQEKCDKYSDPDIPGRGCISIQMHSYTSKWNNYMSSCTLLTKVATWDFDWLQKTQDPVLMVCKRSYQPATTTKPPRSDPNNEKCQKQCVTSLTDSTSQRPVVGRDSAANMCNMMCDVKDASECWPKARDMLARHQRAGQEPFWCEFADHVPYNKPNWWNCKEKCVKLLHDNRIDKSGEQKPGNYYPGEAEERNACAGWCWNTPEQCYTEARRVVIGKDARFNYNVNPVWCDIAEPRKKRNLLSSNLLP